MCLHFKKVSFQRKQLIFTHQGSRKKELNRKLGEKSKEQRLGFFLVLNSAQIELERSSCAATCEHTQSRAHASQQEQPAHLN